MPFLMVRNDITKVVADAIVLPANQALRVGSGTSQAIFDAAGAAALTKACAEIGRCARGDAVITPAFGLSARYIIHAVGPVWAGGFCNEKKCLYRAYWSALQLAQQYRCRSVAFPLLSTGNYGYPKQKALQVATAAISDFLAQHEMQVYLVLYDKESLQVSRKLSKPIAEYIDDHYVQTHAAFLDGDEEPTRGLSAPPVREVRSILPAPDAPDAQSRPPDWRQHCATRPSAPDAPDAPLRPRAPLPAPKPAEQLDCCTMAPPSAERAPVVGNRSLKAVMSNLEETFSQRLLRLITERNLSDAFVYKKANIDRRHFSKIRSDRRYAPTKRTVISFIIALELSLDEAIDLLKSAGFAFSNSVKFDVIICYFIENKQYNIFEINEVLFQYEQPLLGE